MFFFSRILRWKVSQIMSQWDFPFVVMIFSLLSSRISILFRENSNLDGFLRLFSMLVVLFIGKMFFDDFFLVVSLKCGR